MNLLQNISEKVYPQFLWHGNRQEKKVYLTFDDGPTPGITDYVLDQLQQYNAPAAFFCVGRQVEKHPELFEQVRQAGHIIGNHSYSHIDGWKCTPQAYLNNISQCAEVFSSQYLRPPYGRINPLTVEELNRQYNIVMWDVLPRDYEAGLPVDEMFRIVQRDTQPGSIIVMHDSAKAGDAIKELLPRVLEFLSTENYTFASLLDARHKMIE